MRSSLHPNSSADSRFEPWRSGLIFRLSVAITILMFETLLLWFLIKEAPLGALQGAAKHLHDLQHVLFRFLLAYVAFVAILLHLQGAERVVAISAGEVEQPLRLRFVILHATALAAAVCLSSSLYRGAAPAMFWSVVIAWHACCACAACMLFAAAAPARAWLHAVRETRVLLLVAIVPALCAVLAIGLSRMLWAPAAGVTFALVLRMLHPLFPDLDSDAATLTIFTPNLDVTVAEECSGLEGLGLMLAFCAAWLFYFRHEYRFPRALLIVPLALALIFVLNAARIAALILIGTAGYPGVAEIGFHSQAGWIAFNLAALSIAVLAHRSQWLSRPEVSSAVPAVVAATPASPATAAYLMPLLALLAGGMLAHAMSAGFDVLYVLRLGLAGVALIAYRAFYRTLDLRFSWRGVAVGAAVFVLWALCARFFTTAEAVPLGLEQLPPLWQRVWIGVRATSAILVVPLAEELAYRGFLMRRVVSAQFDAVDFRQVSWWALAVSALTFGITHGELWLAGIVAGAAYGWLAIKTGKLGESVAAHATTNSLLAIYVLLFDQWQLW